MISKPVRVYVFYGVTTGFAHSQVFIELYVGLFGGIVIVNVVCKLFEHVWLINRYKTELHC